MVASFREARAAHYATGPFFNPAHRGGDIIYTPLGGTPVTVRAVWGPEEMADEFTQQGEGRRLRRKVRVRTDATAPGGGLADVQLRATVTIEGAEYAVEGIVGRRADVIEFWAVRPEPMELSRPNYRGRQQFGRRA